MADSAMRCSTCAPGRMPIWKSCRRGFQEVVETAERVPGVRVELIREGEGMPAMERSPGTVRLESTRSRSPENSAFR